MRDVRLALFGVGAAPARAQGRGRDRRPTPRQDRIDAATLALADKISIKPPECMRRARQETSGRRVLLRRSNQQLKRAAVMKQRFHS